jgi:purine nucleoside phosphorylase
MGLEILAICAVTNVLPGIGTEAPVRHDEVLADAQRIKRNFNALISSLIPNIAAQHR